MEPGLQLLFIHHDEVALIEEVISPMITMAFDQFKGVNPQIVLLTYRLKIDFPQDQWQFVQW